MKIPCCKAMLVVAGLTFNGVTLAQSYPVKPVRVIVPFAPGGAVDVLARMVTTKVTEALGQPFIVETRPGAGGNLGADVVAKSAPDGYTILQTPNGQAISPALYKKLPFDVEKDFIAVTQLVSSSLILVSSPNFAAKNVNELIALAKAKPGVLNYGSTGVGNPLHLTMELFKSQAGVDITAIPYGGDAPLNTALMGGQVDIAVVPLSTSLQLVRSGKLRALAVTPAKRSPTLPDVPTVSENGVPGFDSASWQAWFVPAKTPRDIVAVIQREAARAVNQPDVRERILNMGSEVVGSTTEEFEAIFKRDVAKYARIVKEAKIPQQE